jgi:hypothetical protein
MQYEQRYCAFVDILGFSELINNLSQGTISSDTLRDLLRIVHAPLRGDHIRSFKGSDVRAQSISDAVCISAACSSAGLAHLLYCLEELARRLLEQGFFVRGALVKGNLYHDDDAVFGEALVRAYRLEQDVARYPRIICVSTVAREIFEFLEQDKTDFMDVLRQAKDGPYYVHVLNLVELVLRSETGRERPDYVEHYNQIAAQIQRRFNESFDQPRHFEKVQWFAKYWNRTIEPFRKEVKQIIGPGFP